jgi:hypothetical protein
MNELVAIRPQNLTPQIKIKSNAISSFFDFNIIFIPA